MHFQGHVGDLELQLEVPNASCSVPAARATSPKHRAAASREVLLLVVTGALQSTAAGLAQGCAVQQEIIWQEMQELAKAQ